MSIINENIKTNRILFAMSTLNTIIESKAQIAFINGIEKEIDYISQLEPMVKYIVDVLPNDNLEMNILCTKDVCERKIKDMDITPVQYFTRAICKCIDEIDECNDIDDNSFKKADSYILKNIGKLKFVYIKIDEDNPEGGIRTTVDYIREHVIEGQFWIDTHGGFRDVSLILNAIVSLLEVYKIMPNDILGVRYQQDEPCRVINQNKSFEIFDFVSGMNEFIRFGSADYLVEHYKDRVSPILDAMKRISDGTRLCDPNEYIGGLDALAEAIDKEKTEDELFNIFLDYIKEDYGDLLISGKRTPLAIIERCVEKKLYQQALTFIESMMPEEYVKNKIIYYDSQESDNITSINTARGKMTYVSMEHFFFDRITDNTNYFWPKVSEEKWKDFCSQNKPLNEQQIIDTIISKKDYLALKCLEECGENPGDLDKRLWKNNSSDSNVIYLSYEKKTKTSSNPVRICSNIGYEEKKRAAQLFRLHNAIKRCRNMVNHSSQKTRPSLETIANALDVYVSWAKEILS